MTLNHSKSIKIVACTPTVHSFVGKACTELKFIHCGLMSCTTPACFRTFFDLIWSLLSTVVENS